MTAARPVRALTEAGVTADLKRRALAFAEANAVASLGDIVETTWCGWKRPRKVRIVAIGAHLIVDHRDDVGFFVDFEMTYVAHRLREDGSSAEKVPESGICLDRLTTVDGRKWVDRERSSRNAKSFNHVALSWTLSEIPPAGRAALDGTRDGR